MKIIAGAHEVQRAEIGNIVSLTSWVSAKVGSGMDKSRKVTGTLVVKGETFRRPGCGFVWQEVELQQQ